jgi:Recombination enhancement, RecA-dependent nuclease
MKRRTHTKAEKEHLNRVQALGCCICSRLGYPDSPALIHHVHVNFGWGRTSHFDVIPLCQIHHSSPNESVHGMGRAEFTAMFGISELELLAEVKEKVLKSAE